MVSRRRWAGKGAWGERERRGEKSPRMESRRRLRPELQGGGPVREGQRGSRRAVRRPTGFKILFSALAILAIGALGLSVRFLDAEQRRESTDTTAMQIANARPAGLGDADVNAVSRGASSQFAPAAGKGATAAQGAAPASHGGSQFAASQVGAHGLGDYAGPKGKTASGRKAGRSRVKHGKDARTTGSSSGQMSPATSILSTERPLMPGSACANASIGIDSVCLPRRFLFVGGLQRSGTSSLASLLLSLDDVSGLSFDLGSAAHLRRAPWKSVVDVHTGAGITKCLLKPVASRCARCRRVPTAAAPCI